MPLYPDGKDLMRSNLHSIQEGRKVKSVAIGALTPAQLHAINAQRAEDEMPEIVAEVLFVGSHVYKRRVLQDGYGIEDIIDEAGSALAANAEVLITPYMTAIQNPALRADRLGNHVHDRAVLECTKYRPNPELFSVMPKGDRIKPQK
jgi:hypothetical protein